jgi:hypothetical protein
MEERNMDRKKLTGLAVATAVVGMLSAGYGVTAEGEKEAPKTVKCSGINSCAGHGECGAPDGSHDCAGKNSCKGKGWVKVGSEEECKEKGGEVLKDKEE